DNVVKTFPDLLTRTRKFSSQRRGTHGNTTAMLQKKLSDIGWNVFMDRTRHATSINQNPKSDTRSIGTGRRSSTIANCHFSTSSRAISVHLLNATGRSLTHLRPEIFATSHCVLASSISSC